MSALRIGLVGAGPWAQAAHAPMLAAGPETMLAGVWARRPEAARELAARHGTTAVETFDELVSRCEAIAFAVPPDVQAELAVVAARAGRHLLLEKPLALTLEGARRVVEAVDAAGVVTQMVLSFRYRPGGVRFLEAARGFEPIGAQAAFLTNGLLDGPFATPWRRRHGGLFDLGPHVLDLLEAALGPFRELSASGDSRWTSLTGVHDSGVVSEVVLSGVVGVPRLFRCELYGPAGVLAYDGSNDRREDQWAAIRRTFAEAVRSARPTPLDAHRGLMIQAWLERALASRDELQ